MNMIPIDVTSNLPEQLEQVRHAVRQAQHEASTDAIEVEVPAELADQAERVRELCQEAAQAAHERAIVYCKRVMVPEAYVEGALLVAEQLKPAIERAARECYEFERAAREGVQAWATKTRKAELEELAASIAVAIRAQRPRKAVARRLENGVVEVDYEQGG